MVLCFLGVYGLLYSTVILMLQVDIAFHHSAVSPLQIGKATYKGVQDHDSRVDPEVQDHWVPLLTHLKPIL